MPAQPPPSSTAEPVEHAKRGVDDDDLTQVRRGKEDKGKKHHLRVEPPQRVARCRRSFIPPPSRIATAALGCFDAVFGPLSRKTIPTAPLKARSRRTGQQNLFSGPGRDRQAIRSRKRLRRVAQALDRRANDRLAQPLSKLAKDWENLNLTALMFLRFAPSASCCEGSAIPHELSSQTRRARDRPLRPFRKISCHFWAFGNNLRFPRLRPPFINPCLVPEQFRTRPPKSWSPRSCTRSDHLSLAPQRRSRTTSPARFSR